MITPDLPGFENLAGLFQSGMSPDSPAGSLYPRFFHQRYPEVLAHLACKSTAGC